MFTAVAQDVLALDRSKYSEELIAVLSQLANCAATLDHYGQLEVNYDGYYFTEGVNVPVPTTGTYFDGGFPPAAGEFHNPAAVAQVQPNGNIIIKNGGGINFQGVWLQRPSPIQSSDELKVTFVSPGDVAVNNVIVVGNILNGRGQFKIINDVILWVGDNNTGGNLVSVGDQTITLTDSLGNAPRVAGCLDPYAVDLYSVATNLNATADLINLRADFTVAIRLRIKYLAIRVEQYWSYRETDPPSAVPGVKLQGEWALDGGIPKLRFTAYTTPADISPTSIGVPARIGREYPDGSCLAVFVRWEQSTKKLTLNVLQPGDTGGSSTNDETTWSPTYGDYIVSEGSEKYLQIRGEAATVASFYFERFAIWNSRLSDAEVKYDFTY